MHAVILGKVQSCKQPTQHLENLHGCRPIEFPDPPLILESITQVSGFNCREQYSDKTLFFVLYIFATHCLHQPTSFCASCLFLALNNVPSNLPSDIVKMDLSRNNINHLRPKQFLLSKDLKLLNLSSNNLQHIDTGRPRTTALSVGPHMHKNTPPNTNLLSDSVA